MNTYTIREMQDVNSTRDGDEIEAVDLAGAMGHAVRNRMYLKTVLVIEQYGEVVATKIGRKWTYR